MKVYKIICELYTEFYRQASLNTNFTFTPMYFRRGNKDHLLICRFIKFLKTDYKDQVDINFLIDFFKFQFSHYCGVRTQYGKNAIMIQWIIGPAAIKRWRERDVKRKWLVRVKLKNEVELKLTHTFNQLTRERRRENQTFTKIYDYEEIDKSRHFNTEVGFQFCLYNTTLYNPKSKFCSTCNFRNECEKILQNNHPNLHKIRIDG